MLIRLKEPTKFVAVYEQTNNQIVHPFGFRKADRTAHQTLDSRPLVHMFALDFLRLVLANSVLFGLQMPLVCTPAIRVIRHDAKRVKQLFQLQKDCIFSTAKDVDQYLTTAVINRMP